MSSFYDVIIVGGGPAGLAAAEHIAKNNLSVTVIEEHDTIGEPLACGEGISTKKFQELDVVKPEISPEAFPTVEKKIGIQRYFFGDNYVCTSRLETVLINRVQFDQRLAENAKKANAEIITSCLAKKLHFANDSVTIDVRRKGELKDANLSAKIVIACDGAASRCVKQVFPNHTPHFVHGVEYKINGVFTDALEFYFDYSLIPQGYGWVFPNKDETNIGITIRSGKNPKERLNRFIKKVFGNTGHSRVNVKQEITGIIPASGPLETTIANRFLVAGDAGGFTNTIFCSGIAIAIHTGRLAADVAVKAIQSGSETADSLKKYEEEWRAMPYANLGLQKAHNLFYNEFDNSDLENIGILLDNMNIENMDYFTKLRIGWRLLRNNIPYSKMKLYKQVVKGFFASRDWGF